jgi:hypothetical protein
VTVDRLTVNGPADQGSAGLVMQAANSGVVHDQPHGLPAQCGEEYGHGGRRIPGEQHDVTIADNNFSGADPRKYNEPFRATVVLRSVVGWVS